MQISYIGQETIFAETTQLFMTCKLYISDIQNHLTNN